MIGIERALFEFAYGVEATRFFGEFLHFLILDAVDLVYLVAGAESVEEVQERHFCLERGKMRDERQVHSFLYGVGREHRKARLTARHNVGVIAEDIERVRRKRSCAYVEHGRQQLARYFVHIRDHEQQALARGVRGGERARYERTVDRARRSAFGLHFRNAQLLPEHVFTSAGCPFVGVLRHGRGRRNRVNRRDLRKSIRHVRCRGVAVDCHLYHKKPPKFI